MFPYKTSTFYVNKAEKTSCATQPNSVFKHFLLLEGRRLGFSPRKVVRRHRDTWPCVVHPPHSHGSKKQPHKQESAGRCTAPSPPAM